jgi:hypothetical protein
MVGIERIRIAYGDPLLKRSLARFNLLHPEKIQKENLSKYTLNNVTLENLKRGNMVFKFDRSGFPTYRPIYSNNAATDQILFSARTEDITTDASACSSYMLFCENKRILAAVHVGGLHCRHLLFHREMLLYAYANLKRMAPKDPISAYISGMYILSSPELPFYQEAKINTNRTNLIFVVKELLSRDVEIKEINIGALYSRQIFSSKTGEYKPELWLPDDASYAV